MSSVSVSSISRGLVVAVLCGVLAACGGGGGGGSAGEGGGTPQPRFALGGTVEGLGAGQNLTLQNNGSDSLVVNANGPFTFPEGATGAYAVTVSRQPAGQVCSVSQGAGNATANVSNVQVSCAALPVNTFSVGGQLSGLAPGASLVVQNNGANNLTLSANGGFTFPAPAPAGSGYVVTVLTQPNGQTCTVSNGSGTVSANVSSVAVACQSNPGGPGTPMALMPVYEGLPQFLQPEDVVAQANSQGTRQFAYVGPITPGTGGINLYQRDTSASYQYESLPMPTNAAALQQQLDAQGARGFYYNTALADGTTGNIRAIYTRDSLYPGPFTYRVLVDPARSDSFVAQLNAQGSDGFAFWNAWAFGLDVVNIFQRDSTAARYTYAVEPEALSTAAFSSQLTSRGQNGFRYAGPFFFPGAGSPLQSANLFVRDTAQNATFTYELLGASNSGAELVSQANAQGARGFYFYSEFVVGIDIFSIYVRSNNCTGSVLCRGIDGVF